MKNTKQKTRIFSVADLIIVILIATTVLSVVFHPYIQAFLGEKDLVAAEYTFVIENVSDMAMNKPAVNEKMYSSEENEYIGTIFDIIEKSEVYKSDYGEEIRLETLQCTAKGEVERTESGFSVGDIPIKAGAQIKVKTGTASFLITVLSVKTTNR